MHGGLADLDSGPRAVLVRTPEPQRLRAALAESRLEVAGDFGDGRVRVLGSTTDEVGHVAYANGVELHELSAEASDLEATFLEITREQPPSEGGDGRHPAAGGSDRAVREDVER